MGSSFKNTLNNVLTLHTPTFITKRRNKYPWESRHIMRLIKTQKYRWRKYCIHKTKRNKTAYRIANQKCTKAVKQARALYEQTLLDSRSNKKFYNYINSQLKSRPDVPSLKLADNSLATTNELKAKSLSEHFSSVFTEDDGEIPFCDEKECLGKFTIFLLVKLLFAKL